MKNEPANYTLRVAFGTKGYSCSLVIRKGEHVIALGPNLPARKRFCYLALGRLAREQKIPKAEQIGLLLQMAEAFGKYAETAPPWVIVSGFSAEAIVDAALVTPDECPAQREV